MPFFPGNTAFRQIVDQEEFDAFSALPKEEKIRQMRCFFVHHQCSLGYVGTLGGVPVGPSNVIDIADYLAGKDGYAHEQKIILVYLNLRYHTELIISFFNTRLLPFKKANFDQHGNWRYEECDQLDVPGGVCNHGGPTRNAIRNRLDEADNRMMGVIGSNLVVNEMIVQALIEFYGFVERNGVFPDVQNGQAH